MDKKEDNDLDSELSNFSKDFNTLWDLYKNKYFILPDHYRDIDQVRKEFPNDWEEYFINPLIKRKEIAKEFESKSEDLKKSIRKIKHILMSKNISSNEQNNLEQIIESFEKIEKSPLFNHGLKEDPGRDYDRVVKQFEDGFTGLALIKQNIPLFISRASSLQFDSKDNSIYSNNNNNMLLKIRDWIIQDLIHQVSTLIVIFILLWLGLGGIKSI